MKYIARIIVYTSLFCVFLVFQNCQKANFSGSETSLAQKTGAEQTPPEFTEGCGDEVCPGDDIDPEQPEEVYAADCEPSAKIKFVDSAANSSLDHLRGSFAFKAPSFLKVQDTRGKLILSSSAIEDLHNTRGHLRIYGQGADALIKSKSDSRGKSILCGISATSLVNHRGGVLVMDGDIGKLSDIRGNVVVINGNIGDIENVRGTIRLINSKILGSVKDFRGVIREQ